MAIKGMKLSLRCHKEHKNSLFMQCLYLMCSICRRYCCAGLESANEFLHLACPVCQGNDWAGLWEWWWMLYLVCFICYSYDCADLANPKECLFIYLFIYYYFLSGVFYQAYDWALEYLNSWCSLFARAVTVLILRFWGHKPRKHFTTTSCWLMVCVTSIKLFKQTPSFVPLRYSIPILQGLCHRCQYTSILSMSVLL